MAQILIFQHVSYEGPAAITDWAAAAGHSIKTHEWYISPEAPTELPELLVVMGGPMNVDDTNEYPWLPAEKAFIRQALDADIPVLGICLGAQLIAAALGEKVYPNVQQELGWLPITLTPAARQHPMLCTFPQALHVFHWHGDTFDLPPGAIRLGSTQACLNQGFALGKCIGLQFHIEIDRSVLTQLIADHRLPDWQGSHVSSSENILTDATQYQQPCRETLFRLLDRWATA